MILAKELLIQTTMQTQFDSALLDENIYVHGYLNTVQHFNDTTYMLQKR